VLGVTRQALNNLVSGKSGVSPEMAVRLSKAFGSSPKTWLGMQADYDLAEVLRRADDIKIKRVARGGLAKGEDADLTLTPISTIDAPSLDILGVAQNTEPSWNTAPRQFGHSRASRRLAINPRWV
jgi:transcriptional regulator with XRE-family HTH domain